MCRTQYTLTRADVNRHTHHRLQQHLRLPDYRRKCITRVLLSVVLAAAASITSLAAAHKMLQGVLKEFRDARPANLLKKGKMAGKKIE